MRTQIASSQLTTYNRIANIGKLNKAGPSKPKPAQQKGKFYQTQVLKNKEPYKN